ncbi:MAG: aminopeptidase P family protein [Acidobacteria bacterium]|nr:MAG: aminopeptidase P family protein [Acidobacteriota bacterium]PYY09101.1 MAG: aminopeptidase P family protein [Acidobacteriota bacterium]
MVSRRRFLHLGTAAASATLAGQNSGEKPASLPPSVAGLKSMKDQARPISQEERRDRQEKARRLMQANRLDAILLMEGTSLTYFTGMRWWGGERMFAMVLPAKGKAFYVCPGFEEGRAREQLAKAPGGNDEDVRIWQEDENPYQRVAQGLKDRGISAGTLGMEETVRFVFSDGVTKAAPQAKITSATPVTAGCRMVKSAHEIELMRLAAKVTLTAYEAAYRALHEGVTQHELADLVQAAHSQLGFSGGAEVQVGEYSALPHGSITPQVIHDGAILLIDGGCTVEGYASDISRTFVLGKPADKMKHVFDSVRKAQSTALATARPGLQCGAVDAAARQIITDAGYGPDYKFFTHRVGHGMGMDGHEWPYLVRGNTVPLATDMTFSDEPGIYIRGEFGVRLEDDMHITENGAELFTPQSLSLENPFGTA